MKILAIGDIHGNTGLVKRLAKKAEEENIDLVIIAGDLTLFEISTDSLIGPFLKAKKEVLLIPGNHESLTTIDFLSELYPNVKNLHGSSFKKNGVGVFGAGGSSSVGPYSVINDEEIFKILENAHKDIKHSDKKIMVTHMHPYGSASEFSGFRGSKGVQKALEKFKPDLHIHSHIHEIGGAEEKIGKTRVVNVSGKEKIFEI